MFSRNVNINGGKTCWYLIDFIYCILARNCALFIFAFFFQVGLLMIPTQRMMLRHGITCKDGEMVLFFDHQLSFTPKLECALKCGKGCWDSVERWRWRWLWVSEYVGQWDYRSLASWLRSTWSVVSSSWYVLKQWRQDWQICWFGNMRKKSKRSRISMALNHLSLVPRMSLRCLCFVLLNVVGTGSHRFGRLGFGCFWHYTHLRLWFCSADCEAKKGGLPLPPPPAVPVPAPWWT